MRRIWAVAAKEFKQVRRDPLTLLLLLGFPAMMLLLYGYAVNFDVRHVPLAVQDRSHSAESRRLVDAFVESTYFDAVAELPVGADPAPLFERRVARAALVIPERYADELAAGRPAPVQFLIDGADANTATTALGYARQIAEAFNLDLAARGLERGKPPVAFAPRVWYNPELRSAQFLVPGLMGFILMITAVLSTAMSVVREKERGTMEQLRATALRPSEMLIGKTIPYLAISLVAAAVIVAAARVFFGVAVAGSYVDLFLATVVYLVGALGFGLLVSSVSDSQAMAFQIGAVSSLLPALFLSGFIFPIRTMPGWLQAISYAVPARYFLIASRGVIIKGASLAPFARDMAFLGVFAVVVLAVSFARLRRRDF